jgi:hypothetical protein
MSRVSASLIPAGQLRFAPDSPLEEEGFELSVPPPAAPPSATANHLSSHHLPRQLGLRFAPKASDPFAEILRAAQARLQN